jgi:hypothetical protein
MMRKAVLALAALGLPATASAQSVMSAHGNWGAIPQAATRHSYAEYVDANRLTLWMEQALRDGTCKVRGMTPQKFDVDVPYAVLVEPDGSVSQVMIAEMGCPALNTIVGSTVVELGKRGMFKPTGLARAAWFRDRIAFARE